MDADPLPRSFYRRPTHLVARELLGHHIVVPGDQQPLVARIVETEAYLGPEDPGSHARRGRHTQAGRLWEEPGTAYVYICYGIHDMLNVVAHEPGGVGAVLVRAAEPVAGHEIVRDRRGGDEGPGLLAGPGKLAGGLGITRNEHDGIDLTEGLPCIAKGEPVAPEHVAVTGRIGLSQGGELMLRFVDETSPALSRPVTPGARSG